jgi:hypothetical protein
MTIAHGTEVLGAANTTAGAYTTAITPAAAPAAACVVIVQGGSAVDLVTSVTYGGIPLSRRRFDIETTEAGAVYIYWGAGALPTGTQNVIVNRTGTTDLRAAISTMTVAAGQTVTVDIDGSGTSTSASNPAWTMTTAAATTACYLGIHSGITTMLNTPATNWTLGPDPRFRRHRRDRAGLGATPRRGRREHRAGLDAGHRRRLRGQQHRVQRDPDPAGDPRPDPPGSGWPAATPSSAASPATSRQEHHGPFHRRMAYHRRRVDDPADRVADGAGQHPALADRSRRGQHDGHRRVDVVCAASSPPPVLPAPRRPSTTKSPTRSRPRATRSTRTPSPRPSRPVRCVTV